MINVKRIVFFVGLAGLLACSAIGQDAAPEAPAAPKVGEWTPVFNGKNLDGWRIKIKGHELDENALETIKVEDGMLRVDYSNYEKFDGRFGHVFLDMPASNYRFRCEYRFTGDQTRGGPGWAYRNSGIMVHCQDPRTVRKDQDFPVCIEVQLLDGMGRPTGNLCTPGTNVEMNKRLHRLHCTNSKSKLYDGEQWVKAEVEVLGNRRIRHYIDGVMVLEYERPQLDPSDADAKRLMEQADGELMLDRGWISLQAESHPVDFRNMEIMILPEAGKPEEKPDSQDG